MDKWNLIVDVPLCENCNNCVLAAKDELVGNDFPGYSAPHAPHGPGVVRISRQVRGAGHMVDAAYVPVMCNHCDDAPCVKAGGGAVIKREDGIVIMDPIKAKGRRDLVDACPYEAIVWNEAEQLPQTWFFDAHLLDAGWKAPRCVDVCPTSAFEAVKISDAEMDRRIEQEGLRSLNPACGSRTRVHYRHLERFDRCFIGGSVSAEVGGTRDCIAGAEVVLLQGSETLARARTDDFGDFKFDGLAADSGSYEIRVQHPTAGTARAQALLGRSIYVGEMLLEPGGAFAART